MKKFLRSLKLMAAVLIGGLFIATRPAWPREMTFDDIYTIDVPPGWTFETKEPGYTIFISPDQKAVFLITAGFSLPKHRDKVADMLKFYDDLRQGSPDRLATLMKIQKKRVAVTIIGDHPDRVKMFYSIEALPGDKMKDDWGTD